MRINFQKLFSNFLYLKSFVSENLFIFTQLYIYFGLRTLLLIDFLKRDSTKTNHNHFIVFIFDYDNNFHLLKNKISPY